MGSSEDKGTRKSAKVGNAGTKVKTGCTTCKARKIKCDETRPICRRCVSSRLICEGYGVWGGGVNAYSHRQPQAVPMPCPPNAKPSINSQLQVWLPVLGRVPDATESCHFEWFMHQTASKIPGCFASPFWDTLVRQACHTEPAVWHAVVALGATHMLDGKRLGTGKKEPVYGEALDEDERFALSQYTKAIRRLQPHFVARDKASIRVTLVTCVVFVCMEFLRSNYRTGNEHLQSGMRLLGVVAGMGPDDIIKANNHDPDPAEDWLVEVLFKLNFQAALLGQSSCLQRPQMGVAELMPATFKSIKDARQRLDCLISQLLYLKSYYHHKDVCKEFGDFSSQHLIHLGYRIQSDLECWLATFESSMTRMKAETSAAKKPKYLFPVILQLLHLYYLMATIMAKACLRPGDEMAYDLCTTDFMSIINQAVAFLEAVSMLHLSAPSRNRLSKSHFTADLGWIPVIYYVAMKCRIHRVRLQAIKLLEALSSKEGIWDSALAASIARRVMEIEEADVYYDMEFDHFFHNSRLSECDLMTASLPETCRLHDVQVVLPDGPMDTTTLVCRRKRHGGSWDVFTTEFDPISQSWK